MKQITSKQRIILKAIRHFTEKRKYPPSVRELCKMVGLTSSGNMHRHLEALKVNGYITWEPSMPRTITVIEGEDVAV